MLRASRTARPSRPRGSYAPLVALLFVLFALACAPARNYGGAASEAGYDDYAAEGYGGADKDYASAEAEAPVVASKSIAREEFKQKKSAGRRSERLAAPPPAPSSTGGPAGAGESLEPEPPPEPEPDAEPVANHGRQIIYTAGLGLSVFDLDDAMAKLEAIPERHGGWLQQRYDNRVILRVPAAKLEAIIAEVSAWGVVEYKTLEALDVTAEYTDLDSRIRVLAQMQAHLKDLLARAENVEQALEIQIELARITAELEQLRAQLRLLDSAIAFSTLAVTVRERGVVEPEPGDDPFPWVDQLGAEATAYR